MNHFYPLPASSASEDRLLRDLDECGAEIGRLEGWLCVAVIIAAIATTVAVLLWLGPVCMPAPVEVKR